MIDEWKIVLYFIGVIAIAISFATIADVSAYGFITMGGGLILYPLWEKLFI